MDRIETMMRKSNTVRFLTALLVIAILSVFFASSTSIPTTHDQSCIQSFHQFAYDGPANRISDVIPPISPWQPELLPEDLPDGDHPYSLDRTLLARSVDEHSEIWISLSDGERYFYLPQSNEGREGIGIYTPDSQSFEVVSHYVENTDLYVVNLHLGSDGTVWGEVRWDDRIEYPDISSVPVLSKFNESSRRFEFAEGVLETPLLRGSNYYNYTKIVLDHQDIFWIFTNGGEIYRYDPISQTTDRQGDSLGGEVIYTALSHEGDVYFTLNEWNADLRLPQNGLFYFSPTAKTVTLVEVPSTGWPIYSGLLIDHTGQLWLGAIGYRDLNNTWNLIYPPYLRTYSNHLGQSWWNAPMILFESSDGKLWYSKYLDSSLIAEGTAWFNPETNEGCVFTNVPTSIVEDSEQRLWIAVDGVLYSAPLEAQFQ
jgi:hypothetical protein